MPSSNEIRSASGPQKIWSREFTGVFITCTLLYLAVNMIQPTITSYAKFIGTTDVMIGVIGSSFTYTCILLKLVSAPVMDTFNRKIVLGLGMCLLSAACFGYAFFPSIGAILVFRLVQGSAQAFTAICGMAMATDLLPREKLGRGLGIYFLGQSIAIALGPVVGEHIREMFSYRVMFCTAGCMAVIGALFSFALKIPFVRTKKFKISLRGTIAPEVFIPSCLIMLFSTSYSSINSFLFIYADERGLEGASIFFMVYALSMLVTRPFFGRISDSRGSMAVIIPCVATFAAAMYLIGAADSLWMLLAAAILLAFGYGASVPILNTLCMRMIPPERRGAASSTSFLGMDLGMLLGPLIGGVIAEKLSYAHIWPLMIIPVAAGFVIAVLCRRRIREADESVRAHS